MANKWDNLIRTIETKNLESASWKSDRESLIEIFSYARENNLDPTFAQKASLSKLRVIIKNAKKSVRMDSPRVLETLFRLAGTLSIVDLRLELNISDPEDIYVKKGVENNKEIFTLVLRKDQLERIKNSTKPYFRFNIDK